MNEHGSGRYLGVVRTALGSLAERRRSSQQQGETRVWEDAETEPKEYSNAHKTVDAIECFLLAYRLFPESFANLPLEADLLVHDVGTILSQIEKTGFVPGAYQYDNETQYLDFAADVVRLLLDFLNWSAHAQINHGLTQLTDQILNKAIQYFIDRAIESSEGYCWSGTQSSFSPGHVYYTAKGVAAISQVLDAPRRLPDAERLRLQQLVRGAGLWFSKRSDGAARYFSDADNETADTIAALYQVYGLAMSWEFQDREALGPHFAKCVVDFWRWLQANIELFNTKEVYYPVGFEDVDKPTRTDDRSTLGTCLAALSRAWHVTAEPAVRSPGLFRYLQELGESVVAESDRTHKMWYREEEYSMWATLGSIEGLLHLEKYAQARSVSQFDELSLEALVHTVLQKREAEIVRLFADEFRILSERRDLQSAGPEVGEGA